MNRYLKLNLSLLLLLFFSIIPAHAQDISDAEILEKMSKLGFNKICTQTPTEEITTFFKNHTKYSTEHNTEELQNLYSDSYLNSDGFDKKTYFDMISKTWKLYPVVTYATIVKDIYIDGDYAIVQTKELANGETHESFENVKGSGLIQSDSYTFYYLQRIGKYWKVTSNSVLYENTSLKYGDAKSMNFSLNAPSQVRAGQDYTATLNLAVPANSFVLASISNEPITYPQKKSVDVFRNIKKDGILERVFTANKNHYNEYSVASVGITKASVVDTKSVDISVTGMAFIMTRVNVIDEKQPPQIQVDKDIKADNDKI